MQLPTNRSTLPISWAAVGGGVDVVDALGSAVGGGVVHTALIGMLYLSSLADTQGWLSGKRHFSRS